MRRLLLVLVLAGALFAPGPASAIDPDETVEVGKPAPLFTLKTLNPDVAGGRVFALRNHVGEGAKDSKTVVLSFAASYCDPCKQELAELVPLAGALEKAGVELAVVVIDTKPEGIAAMKKLTLEDLAVPYPVLSDRFGVLARRYQAEELPKTVIVGQDGVVTWISTGYEAGALKRLQEQLGL